MRYLLLLFHIAKICNKLHFVFFHIGDSRIWPNFELFRPQFFLFQPDRCQKKLQLMEYQTELSCRACAPWKRPQISVGKNSRTDETGSYKIRKEIVEKGIVKKYFILLK
jgi:hypothetical protein